jgi:prepilin-type N-terminal cleavage/methylation domain-containing protein
MKVSLQKFAFTLIEMMIVLLLFTLVTSASFSLLSSGSISFNVQEASIQAEEHARRAISEISKNIRLSSSGKIFISEQVGDISNFYNTTTGDNRGGVVHFQVPLEEASGVLNLTDAYGLKWGARNLTGVYREGDYMAYWTMPLVIGMTNPGCQPGGGYSCSAKEIFHPSITVLATASGSSSHLAAENSAVVAQDISNVTFSRPDANAKLITIEVIAQARTLSGHIISRTLRSAVKLRN